MNLLVVELKNVSFKIGFVLDYELLNTIYLHNLTFCYNFTDLQYVDNESQSMKSVFMDNIMKATRSFDSVSNNMSAQAKTMQTAATKLSNQHER